MPIRLYSIEAASNGTTSLSTFTVCTETLTLPQRGDGGGSGGLKKMLMFVQHRLWYLHLSLIHI